MKNLIAVLQLVPTIISIVQAMENAIPLPSQGKAKLDAVLSMVQSIAGVLNPDMIAAITTVVTTIVSIFNKTGVFSTSTK